MTIDVIDLPSDAEEQALDHRLNPPQSQSGRLGCTLVLGLLLGVIAGGLTMGAGRYRATAYWESIGAFAAAAVFGLLAALLLWSAFQQLLAYPIPMTIIEVDRLPVIAGQEAIFCVKQPGPLRLHSLRVNLFVSRHVEKRVKRAGRSHHVRSPNETLHYENVLDAEKGWIPPTKTRHWIVPVQVPGSYDESGKEHSVVTEWKIEVWGKTAFGLIGFFYPYSIKVRTSAAG